MVSVSGNGEKEKASQAAKGAGEVIALKSDEFKLYNYLKTRSFNPSQWPTIEEIRSQLRLSNMPYALKLVNALIKKDGIDLIFTTDKTTKKKKYGLAPQALEKLVVEKDALKKAPADYAYCTLYLAEPCFGTKAHDENTMKGLALYLDVNNYSKRIQQVIMQGGVVPHMPPFSSKGNINDLKFLGWVKRETPEKSISETMLEERIDNEFEQAFYEEHVNNHNRKKITTLTEAFRAAEEDVKALMNTLPTSTILRIQLGEEDRKNISYIEELYISKWAKEKEEQINAFKNEARKNLFDNMFERFSYTFQEKYLQRALKNKGMMKKGNENRKAYSERIAFTKETVFEQTKNYLDSGSNWESFLGDLTEAKKAEEKDLLGFHPLGFKLGEAMKEAPDFVYWVSNQKEPDKKLETKLKQITDSKKPLEQKDKEIKSRIQDLNSAMSWTEALMHGPMSSVTWFTRHYPVFADEAELAFKKSKDQYTTHFFGWDIKQQLVIHVSPRKNIKIQTGIISDLKKGTELKDNAEVEYQDLMFGEKKMLLIHNIKHIFSDSVGPRAIKEAKLLMNYENMVMEKLFDDENSQPDIVLLGGHMSGGFRVSPWFKKSQHIMEGEFLKDQAISYLITLPTLQSIPNLQWLTAHAFRNWHTKRYVTGPYASAAVIHTEDPDLVNRFHIIDTHDLVEYGKIADELATYKQHLDNDKGLTKKTREELLKIIKERRDSVKANFKKLEIAGDHHLGDSDQPGNYSKDQLIVASQIYQKEHGLPNGVFWDEVLQGTEEKLFNNASRYLGMVPEKFKQSVIKKIMDDPKMSDADKAKKIAQEAMHNMRAISIHQSSEQKHIFKILMKPYADMILAGGGRVGLTSGNHYNQSNRTEDEALELGNMFDESYVDNGQLILFTGKGNSGGVGTVTLEGGKKLFSMHKYPVRQDEVYGMMEHLRRMNNDADIVIGGHRHQTGAGYADNHLVVLHPAYTTINTYTPVIGKPSNIRGFTNVYYAPDKKGDYAVEFVINPTLEKIVKRDKIL